MTTKRILTLNTWGAYGPNVQSRWKYLTQSVADLNVDIACFQEVFDQRLNDKILTDCQFNHSYYPSTKSGLMIASKTPITNTGFLNYKNHSLFDGVQRQCLFAETSWNKQPLLITCTHLSWKTNENTIRTAQLQELTDLVHQKNLPALMCGDFNCTFDSAEFTEMKQCGIQDTMQGFADEAKPTWDNQNPFIKSHRSKFPDRRVDLILGTKPMLKSVKIKHSKIVLNEVSEEGGFASDHYGVCCEVSFGD